MDTSDLKKIIVSTSYKLRDDQFPKWTQKCNSLAFGADWMVCVFWRNGLWCVYLWQVHCMSTFTCRCAVSVSVIYTSHVPVYRWYWDYDAFNQKRIWWRQALVRAITQVLPSSNEQYIRVLEIFLITHCKTYFKNKSLIHYILEKACSSLTTLSHRSIQIR